MYDLHMPKTDPSFCAHCGIQVTNAGRPGRDGKRYCQAKECRAARTRAKRKQAAAFRIEHQAPLRCSSCGRDLQPRRWRSGDELGRWCQKAKCVIARDRARDEAGVDEVARLLRKLDFAEVVISFLQEAVMADLEDYMHSGRRVCRLCGLTSAIPGWGHPTQDTPPRLCEGTLDGQPVRPIGPQGLAGAWPARREYLTPEELAEAYGD